MLSSSGYSKKEIAESKAPAVVDIPGWYHFEVVSVKCDFSDKTQQGKDQAPHVQFRFVVMQSKQNQSPAGRALSQRMNVGGYQGKPMHESVVKANLAFLETLGVLKWSPNAEAPGGFELVDAETGSTDLDTNTFFRCKGKHFIARVQKAKPYNKPGEDEAQEHPDRYEIPFFRIYSMEDPAVADQPRNEEAYKLAKANGFGTPSNGFSRPAAPKADVPEDF